MRRPSNGRLGTSAPTPGCDRFRRGRCPQRPGIPPPLCGPPPFHKGGCCCASSGSLVKGSWHGAAVTEGFRTSVVPLIRHGCAMPPSPLRGEGFGLYFRRCSNVDGVPLIRHGCAVPPSPRGRHCAGEFSLPPSRGKVAPKGPDEGEYRWVRRPSNGRMGTSAPTQGYNRFRRGRCPQRPVDNGHTSVVPLIRHGCAVPPSPLRGEGEK